MLADLAATMGNSGSHNSGNQSSSTPTTSSHRPSPTLHLDIDDWTTTLSAFPRAPYSHKLVVPDRDAHQRLRPTGNGEILHAGGTISRRNQSWSGGVNRSSSIPTARQYHRSSTIQSSNVQQPISTAAAAAAKSRIPMYRHHQSRPVPTSQRKEQMKRFGSEPDLRAPIPRRDEAVDRYKGRKKYRAPQPPANSGVDDSCDLAAGSPMRRARLFKTRAETKKKLSSPPRPHRNVSHDDKPKSIPTQLQRTRSSPEFQAELKHVTSRLGNLRRQEERAAEKIVNPSNKEMKQAVRRSPASGKGCTPDIPLPKVKTFYFGMEDKQTISKRIPNSLGSDNSSESEPEHGMPDISLQLRPILPKKQLEIPRFSPAAAWKLLSAMDVTVADSTLASDEGSLFVEERIEKIPRVPPPYREMVLGSRSNQDKSGDSGISGDETPDVVLPNLKPRGLSWTPQQDLGDDSSLEEGSHSQLTNVMKYPTRPHVFSLSLPRDNQLASYVNDKNFLQPYSSLQKMKRSMSGVLGSFAKKEVDMESTDGGENWFLSRSAPNSLNNGFNSLELTRKTEELDGPKQTRRIMYLPQLNSNNAKVKKKERQISTSYDNLAVIETKLKPQDLQDPPRENPVVSVNKLSKRPKKFTFQSTVRQIERKRLADKLSKEAERKEQQRLRELEAMQRVEEEFQKKRAREKASIRQQLRMFSMDDSPWSSLPPNLDEVGAFGKYGERCSGSGQQVRAEPDGAVSSSSASSPTFKKGGAEIQNAAAKPPVTQILSEYRQPQHDYKEFRTSFEHYQPLQHATTVHPRVTYHMPKATG